MKKIGRLVLAITLLLTNISSSYASIEDISWDEEIIYMVMTDRFYDGDPSNNNPNNVDGSYDKDHLEAYHGGDFRGIIEKVDYLKDLGITTLWITPIVKNIEDNMMADISEKQFGYHGYWAEDFTKIDPHLGTEEDLKELIDVLHENGIKLMVDVVINHSGYGTKNQGAFSGMHREKNEGGDIRNELSGLPDFLTEDKEVRDRIIAWQTDWIKNLKTDKGNTVDYFRVDTVKNVDPETVADFKSAALEIDPDFKMIGENFGATTFQNGGYLDPSMMDSMLDFEFKDLAKSFVRGRIDETEAKLIKRNHALTEDRQMGQFLSSHDEHGFLKMKLGDDVGQFLVASSLQLTAKGQPVIYYGEEIGQSGRRDDFLKLIFSENRYDFDWEKTKDNMILDHYKKMIAIRNAYRDIFSKGDRENLYMDDEVSIFARTYEGESVLVGLNTSNEDKTIEFDNTSGGKNLYDIYGGSAVKSKGDKVSITLPSRDNGGTVVLADKENVPEGFDVTQSKGGNIFNFLLPLIVLLVFTMVFKIIRRK